jgi:hypothetical protein
MKISSPILEARWPLLLTIRRKRFIISIRQEATTTNAKGIRSRTHIAQQSRKAAFLDIINAKGAEIFFHSYKTVNECLSALFYFPAWSFPP